MKKNDEVRNIGLARALSKLGHCSRSRAAALIRAGRVSLNGNIRRDPETGRFTVEDVSQFGTAVNGKPVGRNASADLPTRATISLAGVIDLQWEAA